MKSNIEIMSEITTIAADFFNISEQELLGKKRNAEFVEARRNLFYFLQEEYDIFYPEQSRYFKIPRITVYFTINRMKIFLESEKKTQIIYKKFCTFIKKEYKDILSFCEREKIDFIKFCLPGIEEILIEKYQQFKENNGKK